MKGLVVFLDPDATGACDIVHGKLGTLSADEVRRSALLQLINMGAQITTMPRDIVVPACSL